MDNSVRIKKMLNSIGYTDKQFCDNYCVQINGTEALNFNSVAFSDENIKDVSTSCISIQDVKDEHHRLRYLKNARFAATPILILTNKENVQIWNITSESEKKIEEGTFELIYLYFEKNRFEFMSENLVGAKQGYRQLTLFDALGLIDFSRKATCKILSKEFTEGLQAGKSYLKKHKNFNNNDLNNLTSITMHILSALIINSKISDNDSVPDILKLIKHLSEKYNNYFNESLMFKYGKDLIEEIYDTIDKNINYMSVDHELLGYFYETTLLQIDKNKVNKLKKEFGIYYTPKILSEEIVNSIPFENINPEKRRVFDGSCGSGSLILSACKRLEKLIFYDKKNGFERHEYLTKLILGYDIDRFASEVARLSLLLYNLPYGNKWNVKATDLLQMKDLREETPMIILGNPPYEETRKDKKKEQKAIKFLIKYMEWLSDGGYLGIVLPESFLHNDSGIEARKILLSFFDIMELWSLPGSIFENNCATTVVIARKVNEFPNNNITKVKILSRNKDSIQEYLKNQKWDFSFFINKQKKWIENGKYKITFSPLENILDKVHKNKLTINDVTDNIMGIMLPSWYDGYLDLPYEDYVPYIKNADDFQKYYMSEKMVAEIKYFNYKMSKEKENELKKNYEGLRLRRKSESLYRAATKVLIKMSSTPGKIECISALVDDKGYFPSHSFFVLVSNDMKCFPEEIICSVINSKIINALVRMNCAKRTLTTNDIRNIPLPEFTYEQINELLKYYNLIKESLLSKDIEMVKIYEQYIETIVNNAYKLDSREIEILNNYVNLYNGIYEKNLMNEQSKNKKSKIVTGEVKELYADKQTCLLTLVEEGDDIELPLTENMPGWFLREGAQFSATLINKECLNNIMPLVYSYLDYEDIIAEFDEMCNSDKEVV